MTQRLEKFEGQEVTSAGIELPGAGGGFHDALRVEPRHIAIGEEVDVLMRLRCVKVRHDPEKRDKDDEGPETLQRVHVMRVRGAAFADDPDLVQAKLDETKRRVDELDGIQQLPLGAGDAKH